MSDTDDETFEYGQWVQLKVNTNIIGIVIGADAFLPVYSVQLSPSGFVEDFHGVMLEPLEADGDLPGGKEEAPVEQSNVVQFPGKLTARTKTKGAA